MSHGIVEQVEELIKGAVTAEDLAEIEKVIQDAKGKMQVSTDMGFWDGKSTCWEMCNCPSSIHEQCPSFKNRELPCWEIEGTYCKLDDYGATGRDTVFVRSVVLTRDMVIVSPSKSNFSDRDLIQPSPSRQRKTVLG